MRAEGQELLQQQQATLTQQQQAIPSHQQQVTPSQHQQLLSTAPSQHHQQDEHQQQQQQQPRPTRRSNRNNPQQRQQQDQQEQHQQQPRSRNRTNPQRRSRQQHQQHQQAGALAPWGSQASALPAAGRQVRRASRAVRRDAAGASEACTPAVPVKDWVSRAMQQRGWENSERQKREDYVPTLPEGGVPTEGFRFRLDHGYPLDVRGGGTQGRSRPGAAATHCPFFPPPFCLPLLGGLPQQGPTGCSAQTWGSQMPFEAPDAARAGLSPPLASQQVFSGQLKGSPQQQQRVQQQPHVQQQQRAQQHMQHHSRLAPLPAHYLQSSSDYPFLPMTGVPTRSPLGRETHAEGSSSGTLQRRDESCRGNPSNNAQLLASEADPADFSAAAAATTEAARTGDRQTTAAQPAAATPMGDSLRCREAAGIHAAISTSDEEEGGPFSAAPAAGGTATTTAATPALSSIVALGASVACPSPYAVVREGQLQQHSWQHLSHPYWQSWQLQEHWQLQLQQQQWQQWQQQQWQQWQRLPYTVAAPVDASAYSYVPMQHLQQQQQIQQLHQLQQQQYLNLFQQQRHDWGSQRASGPSRNYQRTPRRVPQQQQQQQYQQQPIQAHYNGGVADSRRGPQRQWQQLSFPVAAADCVRHIAPGTSAAAVATAYPWSVHALAAPSVYDTTALSQSGSPMARTHGHFVAAPYMYTSTAHSAPASTFWSQPQLQQQVQQQVQQQQQQQWQWEAQSRYSRGSSNRNSREQPGRLRTVQDDRNAISGTRHIVEAHSLSCSGKVGRSSATAAAEGSRQVLSSSNADAGESTDSAAVAVKDGEEGSSRDSSRSETHSSPSRRSRSSNSSSSISNSHMLPEEGYSYTKNMAYLAPLVERKKVGPEDFVLLHVIGKGSYGKVMLVRFEQDGQLYALKVLLKESLLRRSQVQHTRTERAVLEVITHPFIVQMHFAFQTPKKLYFVLEYCPGGELFFHLQKDRKFSEERSRFYAAELLLALEHLHKHNVIYRDLKSENVLLDADGHIRLTDFGLSKSGIADNTSARSVCGTPEYIAPEILCQVGHGKAADWWSLGALLYEMLTGLPPFYTANRQALFTNILWGGLDFPADLSPAAVDLLKSLLHRDANERLGAGPLDAEEIKRHPFFAPVDWGRLLAKEIEPPFKPRLLSHEDPKYFPAEVKREPVFSDDGEGPDAAFGSGTVRDAAARMQRSRTPNRRAAVDSSSCGGDSGKISSSSRTRPAANCAADGNCVARAASGTGGHTEDACTNERPHACSSLSSHDSQNTEEDEGDALFKGFSYDERLQGTWGKAAASTDDPYGF